MKLQINFGLGYNLVTSQYTGTMNVKYPDESKRNLRWQFTPEYDRGTFQLTRPTEVFVDERPVWQFDYEELARNPQKLKTLTPEKQAIVILLLNTEESFKALRQRVEGATGLKETSQLAHKYMAAEAMMSLPQLNGEINITAPKGITAFEALRNL